MASWQTRRAWTSTAAFRDTARSDWFPPDACAGELIHFYSCQCLCFHCPSFQLWSFTALAIQSQKYAGLLFLPEHRHGSSAQNRLFSVARDLFWNYTVVGRSTFPPFHLKNDFWEFNLKYCRWLQSKYKNLSNAFLSSSSDLQIFNQGTKYLHRFVVVFQTTPISQALVNSLTIIGPQWSCQSSNDLHFLRILGGIRGDPQVNGQQRGVFLLTTQQAG